MPLRTWDETRYFDVLADADRIRYTGHSGQGAYWATVTVSPPGKSRREQREATLDAIEDAIEDPDVEPGEVPAEFVERAIERRRVMG